MFGMHHTLKQLSVGIAAAASLAVVAVPSALGAHDTWYRNAVSQTASQASVPFVTDTLGGNGRAASQASVPFITDTLGGNGQAASQASVPFITDTLGGNGQAKQLRGYNPQAYVYGGASQAVSKAIQDRGYGRTASPPVAASTNDTSLNWSVVGVGAGIVAAGLLLLLLIGTRLRMNKRGAITA